MLAAVRICRLFAVAAGALAAGLTASQAPAAAAPADFAGVVAEDVYVGSAGYQAKQFKAIRRVGFTTIRQTFRWPEIQPEPGRFDFTATDRFVLAAAKAKVRVQPLLFGEPAWATSRPAGNTDRATFPPADPATFARFAQAVALRYGPGGLLWQAHPKVKPRPIEAYQLWNEPNLPLYWGSAPDAAAYATLIRAATPAIRVVQPKAHIISGGIPDSKLGIRAKPYLQAFLAAGGGGFIDSLGIHPYAFNVAKVMKTTREARSLLNSVGARNVGLVVTEIGWAVGGPKARDRTVSAKAQANLVPGVFRAFAKSRKKLKLRAVYYFAWKDSPTYPGRSDFWGLRTGLFKIDGKPKPVVKTLSRTLPSL